MIIGGRGRIEREGLTPLLHTPLWEVEKGKAQSIGRQRGTKSLLKTTSPLSFLRRGGLKGVRLITELLWAVK
jgi:hypothetical protein